MVRRGEIPSSREIPACLEWVSFYELVVSDGHTHIIIALGEVSLPQPDHNIFNMSTSLKG